MSKVFRRLLEAQAFPRATRLMLAPCHVSGLDDVVLQWSYYARRDL